MPRGRRRKPAELDIHLGNPSKRNRKALEAAAATGAASGDAASVSPDIPPPPIDLSSRGLAIWAALYDYLNLRNQIKSGDAYALSRLCELHDQRSDLLARCRTRSGKFQPVYKTKTTTGATKYATRPEWIEARALLSAIVALEREFGLTPSARASVIGKLAEARDPERPPTGAPAARQSGPDHAPPPPLVVGQLAPKRIVN